MLVRRSGPWTRRPNTFGFQGNWPKHGLEAAVISWNRHARLYVNAKQIKQKRQQYIFNSEFIFTQVNAAEADTRINIAPRIFSHCKEEPEEQLMVTISDKTRTTSKKLTITASGTELSESGLWNLGWWWSDQDYRAPEGELWSLRPTAAGSDWYETRHDP